MHNTSMIHLEKFRSALYIRILAVLCGLIFCFSLLAILCPPEITAPVSSIRKEIGYAWVAPRPVLNDWRRWFFSPAIGGIMLEDGRPLPLGDAIHNDIRENGKGLYSVKDNGIWFSTPLNDSPLDNGKQYTVIARFEIRYKVGAAFFASSAILLWMTIIQVRRKYSTAQRFADALPRQVWTLFEWIMPLAPLVFCAAALLYLAACAWALYSGYASFAAWPLRRLETMIPAYRLHDLLVSWIRNWAVLVWAALILCFFCATPVCGTYIRPPGLDLSPVWAPGNHGAVSISPRMRLGRAGTDWRLLWLRSRRTGAF